MPVGFTKIRLIVRPDLIKYESADNANLYEFQAADGNVYSISRFEEKTFPEAVATEMLAANANLEIVSRS